MSVHVLDSTSKAYHAKYEIDAPIQAAEEATGSKVGIETTGAPLATWAACAGAHVQQQHIGDCASRTFVAKQLFGCATP